MIHKKKDFFFWKKNMVKKEKPLTRGEILIIVVIILVILGVSAGLVAWDLTRSTTPTSVQPESSVVLTNNTSQNPLKISLQILTDQDLWSKYSGNGTLGNAVIGDNVMNPPNYQLVTLGLNESITVLMPSFSTPWRITPLSGSQGGMPTLVECNKDIVCDASGVDGVNYKMNMYLTVVNGISNIDFSKSPCEPGQGCVNPSVNGTFTSGKVPQSPNCPYGTCNLTGESLAYCDALHFGQCANSSSTWLEGERASTCDGSPQKFTIYCYSHDDANSSPTLVSPYKINLIYADL